MRFFFRLWATVLLTATLIGVSITEQPLVPAIAATSASAIQEANEQSSSNDAGAPPSAAEIAGQQDVRNAIAAAATADTTDSDAGEAKNAVSQSVSSSGAAPASEAEPPKNIRLFGTVEFRGPLKNIPKWERVLGAEKKLPSFGGDEKATLTPEVAARWATVRNKIKNAPIMDQIQAVNNFFNQWPYKIDMNVWGVEDYWATPSEFVRKSGDCEDYAIAKYYAFRSMGIPASQLRVVALKDTIRNLGHAVLAVYVNDTAYILDNLTNLVLVHSRLTHYAPQFSVNEEFRWAHIKPMAAPK